MQECEICTDGFSSDLMRGDICFRCDELEQDNPRVDLQSKIQSMLCRVKVNTGFTWSDLADKFSDLDIKPDTLQRWANGSRKPNKYIKKSVEKTLKKLIDGLH